MNRTQNNKLLKKLKMTNHKDNLNNKNNNIRMKRTKIMTVLNKIN